MLHALSCLTSRLSVSNWMLLILKAPSPAMTFWRATGLQTITMRLRIYEAGFAGCF